MRARLAVLLAGIVVAGPAWAQATADCGSFKWSVAREQAAFAGDALPSVQTGGAIPGASAAVQAKLAKQSDLTFDVAPSHKPKSSPAYAGVFALPDFAEAGAYNVTISDEGWIDAVQDGRVLKQIAFSGSHSCPTVRKSVRFDFAKGPATIMISDSPHDTMKIDVVPPAP